MTRHLNEAEVRAATKMFWSATQYATRCAMIWARANAPSKEEFMTLAVNLGSAEQAFQQMIEGCESDGHSLQSIIDFFSDQVKEIIAQNSFPASLFGEEPPAAE